MQRRLAAHAVAFAALAASALADIELPSAPPPQPQPVAVKVFVGESVDIPLSGVSRSGTGMQFLIRKRPASGTLSEIRMTGANTGVVTYTHSAAAGPGVDRFRYAAASPGAGVSTPAEVVIDVTERPSVFVAPARLDFPDTSAGQTSTQTFEIRNDGGGVIEGKLKVPAPWKLVGSDGGYSLGPGGSLRFTVGFSPATSHMFTGVGEFSHAPGVEIGFSGRGYDPIEIVPREIGLDSNEGQEVRTGGFLLRNVSNDDRVLRIVAPPEVVVQDSVNSAAGSESQVALHTRAGFLGAFEGTIKVTGDGVSLEVPLHVAPAPARLSVKPESIDYGKLDAGRSGREKITLHNAGGSEAALSANLPEGVELRPFLVGQKIPPGESRDFEVVLSRPLAGRFSDTLSISASESTVRIPLAAMIGQPWSAAANPLQAGAPGEKAQAVVYSKVPTVMEVGVMRQTKTELDLVWKKGSPDIEKYVIYLRTVVFDSKHKPQFQYKRLDRLNVRFVRDQARVTLAGLRPGESVTLLIVGIDSKGLQTYPSPPFTVATKPAKRFAIPWTWLLVGVLVLLAALIARERRLRRLASDAEIARIGRP